MNCTAAINDEDLVAHYPNVVTTLAIISVCLNSLLFIVMLKTKKIRENSANCFINAITLVNIITGFEYLLFEQYLLKGTKVAPKNFWRFVLGHSVLMILINLQTGLSIDRFWAICYPFSYLRNKLASRRITIISISVFSAIFIAVGCGMYVCAVKPAFNSEDSNSIFNCTKSHGFKTVFKGYFGVFSLVAIFSIVGLNGSIIFRLLRRRKYMATLFSNDSHKEAIFNEEIQIAKTMLLIITGFVLFWSPHTIRLLGAPVTHKTCHSQETAMQVNSGMGGELGNTINVIVLNCIFDPIIYISRMRDFRNGFIQLFSWRKSARVVQSSTRFKSFSVETSTSQLSGQQI